MKKIEPINNVGRQIKFKSLGRKWLSRDGKEANKKTSLLGWTGRVDERRG